MKYPTLLSLPATIEYSTQDVSVETFQEPIMSARSARIPVRKREEENGCTNCKWTRLRASIITT